MPLVSGVCRTASAPMLSHGGSRLNASKPEANPKTRYPTHNNTSQHNVFRRGFVVLLSRLTVGNLCGTEKPWHQESNLFLSLREFSSKRFSFESPLKPLPPARPRWRQVSHIITSKLLITTNKHTLSCLLPDATCASCMLDSGPPFQSGEGTTQPFPIPTSPSKREDMHWLA